MLTGGENHQLAELLKKLSWPVDSKVFDALCENFSVTPVELAVMRKSLCGPEVFMVYRNDKFFRGWHITGSIVVPGRTTDDVLRDIVSREVGISFAEPHFSFVRFRQFMKGSGPNQSRRGQEVSLIHILFLPDDTDVSLDGERGFFPLNNLPRDTLQHHKVVLADVREYLARN
jgi:hypothetical protein